MHAPAKADYPIASSKTLEEYDGKSKSVLCY